MVITRLRYGLYSAVLIILTLAQPARAESSNVPMQASQGLKMAITDADILTEPVKQFVIQRLLPLSQDAALASAITQQNNQQVSLPQIREIDIQWIEAEDELAIHREKLNNPCAKRVEGIVRKNIALVEVFVMDNQGALVCMNNITSDYWQGDESKWRNTYQRKTVDIGPLQFDKSAYTHLQQVSLPIMDANQQIIGAITFGINISRVDVSPQ